jgi:hypothetical protein
MARHRVRRQALAVHAGVETDAVPDQGTRR